MKILDAKLGIQTGNTIEGYADTSPLFIGASPFLRIEASSAWIRFYRQEFPNDKQPDNFTISKIINNSLNHPIHGNVIIRTFEVIQQPGFKFYCIIESNGSCIDVNVI